MAEWVDRDGAAALGPPALSRARLEAIAGRHGTPCFVYDAAAMRAAAARLLAALPAGARLFYAVKANPNPAVVALFGAMGLGAEVASRGELALALTSGIAAERIVFSGPAKTDADLAAAVAAGILAVQIESPGEFERLGAIASSAGRRVGVTLRLDLPASQPLRRGGWAGDSAFGMDEVGAASILGGRRTPLPLDIIGFHNHQASGSLVAGDHVARFGAFLEAVLRLSRHHPPILVNFGGGLGAPVYADDPPLDLGPIAAFLGGPARTALAEAGLAPQFGFEAGRYLVGPAGAYLCRVVAVKETRGRRFAALDGGSHHVAGLSGTLRFLRRPVAVFGPPRPGAPVPTELCGPLCTPTDRLASAVPLPADLAPGDLIVFGNCGAYARQASALNFLGHDWPPEILVDGGRETLVARRVRFEEVLALQAAPDARALP
ncbi:type III PLP-dependent enzyme [Aurantimonas sp. HBX-1]|uniref:type III PLP-dependent enzyme n=1 Tax=Aurantimonas sp. HBX-1 TaxID=2906072 RepID=UPI001F3E896B|nr:type III PLP-dependent enzyme [Aurantimonas sp. HBX-1]UIJ73276.1 type III PLP-dependent enzyme [Aurantimonas sp. HBX-1]